MMRALSKDALVIRSQGLMFISRHTRIAAAAFAHSRASVAEVAGAELDPGKERPITSIADAIVLAVYIPPHAPGPGQA